MSDNFDDVERDWEEEDISHKKRKKKSAQESARSAKQNYDRFKKLTNGSKSSGSTSSASSAGSGTAGSAGTTAGGGTAAGSATAGGTAAGGTAAGGAAAGGTAAGGAAAGGTAAGGAAAGGAAAGGAAAGGAAVAGLAAVAWPIVLAIIIIVVIIIIILLIIGAVTFFQTAPGMMMDKITEISSGLWRDFKSFFEGNSAYITEEDQTTLAQYIENMGYDVVGYGFAAPTDLQTNQNSDTGGEEIDSAQSRYLLAYLLADYNTYAIDSPVKQAISDFWTGLWGGDRAPLTGMLKFDDDGWLDITQDVEVNRDQKTVTIKVWNPEAAGFNIFNTDTYTYSLDGWTGRYGKPLEFLLALHLSTMAPDLAYHVASDKEFDTKVHIDFQDIEAYLKIQYVVNSSTISNIKSEEFEGVRLWEIEGLEYIEDKIGADGSLVLSPSDLSTIEDKMSGLLENNEDVVSAIEALGMTAEGLTDAVNLSEEHGGQGKQLLSRQPYITYVEKAWYKNIYFMVNDEIRSKVSDDEWLKTAPDFNAYENVDAGMIEQAPYDFHPSPDSDQANIVSDTSKGVYQIIENRQSIQISQKAQPLKGSTNSRIKELFVGAGNDNIEGENPKPEYYIYDGSEATALAIEELKEKEREFRNSGWYTEAQVSDYINSIDEKDYYREIDFNKNSLSALAILENMQSEDADFLLRDFKSLLIELKYFKATDLTEASVSLLDWIIPDYNPEEWPNRKYEKQNYDYGTYIRSKKSMDELKAQEAEGNNGEEGNAQPSDAEVEESAESGDGFPNSTTINNVTYRNYKQYMGSYANTSYWNGTMSSSGCGPTAAAIVASGYGKLEATPRVIANYMVKESTSDKVSDALEQYGITSTVYTDIADTNKAVTDIRNALNQGKPVIVLINRTTNPARNGQRYSGSGHFLVLLGEENGTLIMSNPAGADKSWNEDTWGLEAFVRDYMTEYIAEGVGDYIIPNEAPTGSSIKSTGFEPGMTVITPGIGEVTRVSGDSITIKFTETNLVKDMTMTIKGFAVNSSISVGDMLDREQEIGLTTEEDILLIFRAPNKSIIENVEEYMNIGEGAAVTQAYVAQEGDLQLLANLLHHEGCEAYFTNVLGSSELGASASRVTGYVLLNRAILNYGGHGTTIREQILAPGQYSTAYDVTEGEAVTCDLCLANAEWCLTYDCSSVVSPSSNTPMPRNVVGQSGWCQCSPDIGKFNCWWWVDTTGDGQPTEYSGGAFDTFFCQNTNFPEG